MCFFPSILPQMSIIIYQCGKNKIFAVFLVTTVELMIRYNLRVSFMCSNNNLIQVRLLEFWKLCCFQIRKPAVTRASFGIF